MHVHVTSEIGRGQVLQRGGQLQISHGGIPLASWTVLLLGKHNDRCKKCV